MGSARRLLACRACIGVIAATLLIVAGCAPDLRGSAAVAGAASPLAASWLTRAHLGEEVFTVGYDRIAEIYLEAVDLTTITVSGLSGLAHIDPDLWIARSERSITLHLGRDEVARFPQPDGNDAADWAMLTVAAIKAARTRSSRLRGASADHLYEAVFDAIMGSLDDYSRYSGPDQADRERAAREGFGGIGIIIDRIDGRIVVRSVEPQTPAARAGLASGDVVLAIDGTPVGYAALTDVSNRLRGPIGTMVTLEFGRPDGGAGAPARRTVQIKRARVVPNTVTVRVDDDVAILQLKRFNAATTHNLRRAIERTLGQLGAKARGVILDLRGNPGGLLDQAVAVADLFIRRGRIIATAGRHPDSWQRFDATGKDVLHGLPMVVLLDGRSASAAEIVAAALQDSRRAVVVGASSFGKGSVQTVTRLPNNAEMFLTWSRLYAPSGYTLHRQGVHPTICTSQEAADAEDILADVRNRAGADRHLVLLLRDAAPEDTEALAHLRRLCPWKAHAPDLDLHVAEALLGDRQLYFGALSHTIVAER